MRIRAVRSDRGIVTRNSGDISGTTRPTWNQWIDFGCQRWHSMFVQVLDHDIS